MRGAIEIHKVRFHHIEIHKVGFSGYQKLGYQKLGLTSEVSGYHELGMSSARVRGEVPQTWADSRACGRPHLWTLKKNRPT
jgi:hypothetical protein